MIDFDPPRNVNPSKVSYDSLILLFVTLVALNVYFLFSPKGEGKEREVESIDTEMDDDRVCFLFDTDYTANVILISYFKYHPSIHPSITLPGSS